MKTLVVASICMASVIACAAEMPDAPRAVRPREAAKFIRQPVVKKTAQGCEVCFAVSAPVDVEVSVLNAEGKVVRHLAAGLLGPAAPAPLRANTLEQTLAWDGKDDDGKQAAGAQVRMRLGMAADLERYLGWDGLTFEQDIVGLTVGPSGELYVMASESSWGRSELRVLDKDGKYLRSIIPFSAKTPLARRKAFGAFDLGGQTIPIVFNAQDGSTQTLLSALRDQDFVVHPDGHVILTSANGSLSNHGPAQYLLALHPEGGAPERTGYLGPMVREAQGFLGGAGNRDCVVYEGLALSPDGQTMYQSQYNDSWAYAKARPHAVYKLAWTDKARGAPFLGKQEPGNDDEHFQNPAGLATDAKGNVYVCDHGNNRVMIFSPDGKLLAKFSVSMPYQVSVHSGSREIYVLSRKLKKPSDAAGTFIAKFSPVGGEIKELARIDNPKGVFKHMGLDRNASPARLYVSSYTGWNRPDALRVLLDKGAAFEWGAQVNSNEGLSYPLFVAADEKRGAMYVRTFLSGMRKLDLGNGSCGNSPVTASEVMVAPTGQLYTAQNWAWTMKRYTPDGKPEPFSGGGKQGEIGPWRLGLSDNAEQDLARVKGFGQGGRGYAFGPNGNVYVIKMPQYAPGRVDMYSAEGVLIKERLIDNLPYASGGIGVDAQGNIYLGVNLRPLEGTAFYAQGFEHAPTDPWVWYKSKRESPWDLCYYNTYLFHSGQVIKFPPTGGRFFNWNEQKGQKPPADMPQGLPVYRSGYLREKIAVEGGQWLFKGCSPLPTSGESWGDPSCNCWNVRMSVDPYGRVFVPDALRFAVNVIDASGNLILRMGTYGNCDDADPKGPIRFAWPCYVDCGDDRLYVSDTNANRVVDVKLSYTESVTVKF